MHGLKSYREVSPYPMVTDGGEIKPLPKRLASTRIAAYCKYLCFDMGYVIDGPNGKHALVSDSSRMAFEQQTCVSRLL